MRRINKPIALFMIVFLFSTIIFFQAQVSFAKTSTEAEILKTYDPSILPDSPFYFLTTWWEEIQEFITVNPSSKVELQIKLANKRLVEAQKLADKGKPQLAKKSLDKFKEKIEKARQQIEEAKDDGGKNIDQLINKLKANNLREQEVLHKIYDKVPEQAKDAVAKATENSNKGIPNAIEKIQNKKEQKEDKKASINEEHLKKKKDEDKENIDKDNLNKKEDKHKEKDKEIKDKEKNKDEKDNHHKAEPQNKIED